MGPRSRSALHRWLALLMVVAMPVHAGAATADDGDAGDNNDAALQLADTASMSKAVASDWRVLTELAWSDSAMRDGAPAQRATRLSVDVRYDASIAPGWRVMVADRLDAQWRDPLTGNTHETNVNTLKEAYLSWQARPDLIADLGRVNVRNGVASGYNPTDWLRAGAVRSVVSSDPASLRENRLGTVMLRAQQLWNGASLTGLYAPRLADAPNAGAFNVDVGATNQRNRWLLALGHAPLANLNLQWLMQGGAGQSPQLGLNLTTLFNDATVGYLEWSGGRSRSLFASQPGMADDSAFRARLSTGLTWTSADKLTLTAEFEYNGAGLDKARWEALWRDNATTQGHPYGPYRSAVASQQDLPTRQRIFLRANWQDALLTHLDLTGFVFHNLADASRQTWLEARYHWTHVDVALQWQAKSGRPGSEFGATPDRRVVQGVATYFF